MERSPNISWLFHVRLLSLLSLLALADSTGVKLAYDTTQTKGPSVQLVFGFEYAILLVSVLNVTVKYALHVIDYVRANGHNRDNGGGNRNWEEKAVYLLYSELALSASKVALYLTFITLMMKIHTFPLFAIRPMYLSMRSFKKALNDVIQSRRAIANMNSLYPNATAQDLLETDNVCIICREEMVGTTMINGQVVHPPSGLSKKLPCGHIFHISCLRSWFQRQQTCPTCRLDVLRASISSRTINVNNIPPNNNAAPGAPNANLTNQPSTPVTLDPQQQQMIQQMFLTQLFLNQLQMAPPPTTTANTSSSATSPASSTTVNNESQSSGTTSTFGLFPQMPMPSSNVDLSTLSDDELRRLVRAEREALEARLRLYSQSRILIDAAITNLLQFNSALNATGRAVRPDSSSDITLEDRTGVSIPSDLISGESHSVDTGDGHVLSEEEIFRQRTNSDVRRVRVSRFSSNEGATGGENEDNKTSHDDAGKSGS